MDLMDTAQLLGNFGEFFGAIAVVATLMYLAVQVRHSKLASEAHTQSVEQAETIAKAQVRNSITGQILDINTLILANPSLIEIQQKAQRGEPLDEHEDACQRALSFIWFKHMENVHYQFRQGLFDEPEYEAQKSIWRFHARGNISWRDNWRASRTTFSPQFANEIDQIIAEETETAPN